MKARVAGAGFHNRTLLAALMMLASFGVCADQASCTDNADCKKGEACLDQGAGATGTCVARCAPLRLQIVSVGQESATTSDGNFIRYKLAVTNWQQFPDALFALTTDLPPCDLNANASRSWVDIFDATTQRRIYRFCALTQAKNLTELWFGLPQGTPAPARVHITMNDRRTGKTYCSNEISIASP